MHRQYTTYIKQDAIITKLGDIGYMFRPWPAIVRPTKHND